MSIWRQLQILLQPNLGSSSKTQQPKTPDPVSTSRVGSQFQPWNSNCLVSRRAWIRLIRFTRVTTTYCTFHRPELAKEVIAGIATTSFSNSTAKSTLTNWCNHSLAFTTKFSFTRNLRLSRDTMFLKWRLLNSLKLQSTSRNWLNSFRTLSRGPQRERSAIVSRRSLKSFFWIAPFCAKNATPNWGWLKKISTDGEKRKKLIKTNAAIQTTTSIPICLVAAWNFSLLESWLRFTRSQCFLLGQPKMILAQAVRVPFLF